MHLHILYKKLKMTIFWKIHYNIQYIMNNTCTKHNTCKNLANQGANHGAAIIPLLMHSNYGWVFYLGRERHGKYKGEYNLFAGKGEPEDNNDKGEFCWIKCAIRELWEEGCIDASFKGGLFDSIFRSFDGKCIRVFMHYQTPVFVGVLPKGTSRASIKKMITINQHNPSLGPQYKEMDDVEIFYLKDGKHPEGKYHPISSFAYAVSQKVDTTKL